MQKVIIICAFLSGLCIGAFASTQLRRRAGAYPRRHITAASCAVLFACMAAFTGPGLAVIPLCALAFVLLYVSLTDISEREIPDGPLIFGGATGAAWVAASYFWPLGAPRWHDALLGAMAGAVPLLLIDRLTILLLGKDGFGYGDIKLMAVAGLFMGWQTALLSLFFAVIAGGAFSMALLLTLRTEKGAYIAFGPFLALGILAALWFGRPLMAALFL